MSSRPTPRAQTGAENPSQARVGRPYHRRVQIRPIDVDDSDEFGRWSAITREALLFERPDAPVWSQHEFYVVLSLADGAELLTAYGAFEGETMLAAAMVALPMLDNLDKANLSVWVAPSRRRQGIGGALLEHLVSTSVRGGRTTMLASSWLPQDARDDHAYRRFADQHGFALANTEIRRTLELPVPNDKLERLAAEAREQHREYRIETYVDDVPNDLLASYCHLRNQVALDAPTGDVELEARALTPEIVLKRHAIAKEQGRTTYLAFAVEPGGDAVAYTSLVAPAREPVYVYQAGTLVRRDHRGHRLGLAVKVANLVALQKGCPGRRIVNTENAGVDGPMLQINEKLGFRSVEVLADFQRIVSVATTLACRYE
jgi:GNAT superfamily N-acetyltransferase